MPSYQRVMYFPNAVKGDKRSLVERINEFISDPDVIATHTSWGILNINTSSYR